jgi:hypothetical protein
MSKKLQYGRDLTSLIIDGMMLSQIIAEVKGLMEPIEQSLLLHNIYETFSEKKEMQTKELISKNLSRLKATLKPRIAYINEGISLANKMLKGLDFDHKIPKLEITEIIDITKQRLQTMYKIEDAQELSNRHFRTKLQLILEKPGKSTQSLLDKFKAERYIEEVESIKEDNYRVGIEQAIDVCSIGYYSAAVFIAGRTIEELINDMLAELFRLHKLKRFKLSDVKFKNKIGILLSSNQINEDMFHRLSNVRLDRNEFGHPSKRLLSKKQAHLRILLIVEIIVDLEKRLKKLKQV